MLANHSFDRPLQNFLPMIRTKLSGIQFIQFVCLFVCLNLRHLPQFSTIPQSTLRHQKCSVLPDEAGQLSP